MIRKFFLILIALISVQQSTFSMQAAASAPVFGKADHAIVGALLGVGSFPAGLVTMMYMENCHHERRAYLVSAAALAVCVWRSYVSFRAILGPTGAIIATAASMVPGALVTSAYLAVAAAFANHAG